MDAGSEHGFHRGEFSGMGFSSLMVVDIVGMVCARRQSDPPRDPRRARGALRDRDHVVETSFRLNFTYGLSTTSPSSPMM